MPHGNDATWLQAALSSRSRSWLARWSAARITAGLGGVEPPRVPEIAGPRDATLVPRNSPAQLLHTDPASSIGGIAALLFQSLEPRAAAAVTQHSTYHADPWGRLVRTGEFYRSVCFAERGAAERLCERVRRIHDSVNGVTESGRPYSAADPELLSWVHCTQVWSFLQSNERFSRWPLHESERDHYVQDMTVVAREIGLTDPPDSVAAVVGALDRFVPGVAVGPDAQEIIQFLRSPPVSGVARVGYGRWFAAHWLLPAEFRAVIDASGDVRDVPRIATAGAKSIVRLVSWAYGPDHNITELHRPRADQPG